MRTFIPALITTLALFSPSLSFAQTPPPPATPGSHPNAVPPTKAPTQTLAPTPLPNGQMSLTPTTTAEGKPVVSAGAATSASNSTFLNLLIGAGALLLAGIGVFFLRRRGSRPQL